MSNTRNVNPQVKMPRNSITISNEGNVANSATHAHAQGSRAAVHNNCSPANVAMRPTTKIQAGPVNCVLNGLRPARDLTLGGRTPIGATKKVFAPNLNAVRNKNVNVKTSKDFSAERGARRGARGGGKTQTTRGGHGGGSSKYIQTTGVFSEGAGAAHIRKSSGGSGYGRISSTDDLSSSVRKRNERKQDEKAGQRPLNESDIEDEELDSSDYEADSDKTDLVNKPVHLCEGLWRFDGPIEKDLTFTSPMIDSSVTKQMQNLNVAEPSQTQQPSQYGRYPRSLPEFLDKNEPQLFLMQLPDILPCVRDDAAEQPPSAKDAPASPAASDAPTSPLTSTTAVPKYSVLTQLEEGQIGKIVRYRSGRVKLQLGETRFDLEMGLEAGFLQEIMSISTNREQRNGDMINLGPVQAKLKATPDWAHLFKQHNRATRRPNNSSSTTSREYV